VSRFFRSFFRSFVLSFLLQISDRFGGKVHGKLQVKKSQVQCSSGLNVELRKKERQVPASQCSAGTEKENERQDARSSER
jgi:hypothetical protein